MNARWDLLLIHSVFHLTFSLSLSPTVSLSSGQSGAAEPDQRLHSATDIQKHECGGEGGSHCCPGWRHGARAGPARGATGKEGTLLWTGKKGEQELPPWVSSKQCRLSEVAGPVNLEVSCHDMLGMVICKNVGLWKKCQFKIASTETCGNLFC